MKTITGILLVLAMAVFSGCEGPEGPMGPPGPSGPMGPPGADGVNILGNVIEIEGSFSTENDYRLFYDFPDDIEVFESDVVLVYILWEVADNLDVWRLLPQTVVLDEGILQYNFDYTFQDVSIFLEGSIPFDQLLPAETDNQVFRIAIMPADMAVNKSVDVTDLNAVMKSLQINPSSIEKFKF